MIKVGGATEPELKEKKHRIEDALSTARAAVEEGIVAGGGVALIHAIPALEKIKRAAMSRPAWTSSATPSRLRPARSLIPRAHAARSLSAGPRAEAGHGFDALTGEYGDMFKKGIVDPPKVTRSALENAASIAAMLLTTETLVTDIPEKAAAGAPGAGHDHGGGMDF